MEVHVKPPRYEPKIQPSRSTVRAVPETYDQEAVAALAAISAQLDFLIDLVVGIERGQ